MRQFGFLLYVLYCFYIGILLVFLPWSPVWEANGLLVRFPALATVALSGPARGMVSALGVILLWMGVTDSLHFIRRGVGPS